MNAVLACAAVALATTFTSCEKEEFNVKFEPNPAMVCFTPNVIDAATNENVTKMLLSQVQTTLYQQQVIKPWLQVKPLLPQP